MPRLSRSSGLTDSFQLPRSKVTVVMKKHASGRDHHEALQACVGDGDLSNRRQAYIRYLGYLAAALILEWDAQDEVDGELKPAPVTSQRLAMIEDEEDYDLLIQEAGKRVHLREADPEKERPFATPSTPSSQETSSPTPLTTPPS